MIYDLLSYLNPDPRLSIEEIAAFFDEVPEEEINQFTYQKRGGTLVGIKDFFKAYHHSQTSRYRKSELETAKNRFLMIYRASCWDILKIKKEVNLLTELIDLKNNWRDTTEHEGTTDFTQDDKTIITENNTHTDRRGISLGLLEGSVDAAQLSKVEISNLLECTKDKILGYLDPTSRSRKHQITIEGGENQLTFNNNSTNKTDNTHKTKNKSTTHFSNTSKDIIDVINLKMPNLLEQFLDKFNIMFLY